MKDQNHEQNHDQNHEQSREQENEDSLKIEGRNEVLEALRAGRTIDKLYVQENINDGPIRTILSKAKEAGCVVSFISKEKMNEMSETHRHQGVIACAAAFPYVEIDDMLARAEEKGEKPFLVILDGIEDPHNLGAIIRTAEVAGAHGVIIPKRRSSGLTATVMKASAGALNYMPVAKVTNLSRTIEELKEKGLWFVCADMDGESMYQIDMTGPICLIVGSEGEGVSRLVKENCDYVAKVPMKGEIESLNASVAAGVLMYETVRQRLQK